MIKRVPIKIQRTPIKVPDFLKPQIKLWELMEITRDDDIYAISKHFDMLMMKFSHRAGYNSLSLKDPMNHKNWVHFERVYEICRMKGWNTNLYIEGQFERSKGWSKMKYPLPNMLYSRNALVFFTNYVSSLKQMYEKDSRGADKQKGKETKTIRSIIVDDIVSSIQTLSMYLDSSKHSDLSQYKALRIFQSWGELSPYYLYSVPWFHDVMKEIEGDIIKKYEIEFETISKSPMIKDIILETVQQAEEYFGIPNNIQF